MTIANSFTHGFGQRQGAPTGGKDDRWLRLGWDANPAVSGTLKTAAFEPHLNKYGVLPGGVGVHFVEAEGLYIPFDITNADHVLAGFTKVELQIRVLGVPLEPATSFPLVQVATIDRKFLPIVAQRDITRTTPTSGQFVLID